MTDMPPLVSIGIPVYNGGRLLEECLQSLLQQTYRNLEVVISDNASNDATQSICRSFAAADGRVRYHRNGRNIGQYPNFKRALALSRGEYFMWACADDIRPPGIVHACVAALEASPVSVLAHGPIIVRPRGATENVIFANCVDLRDDDPAERVRRFTRHIESNAMIYALYRMTAIRSARFWNHLAEDYLVSLQMCMLGRAEYVATPLIVYRERHHVPRSNRMYVEVPVTLSGLLKEGKTRRRKCWTALVLGCWFGLRLRSVSIRQRLRAVFSYLRNFVPLHRSRLAKEIVFQSFEPLAMTCSWIWAVLRQGPWAGTLARMMRICAPSLAPRSVPQ